MCKIKLTHGRYSHRLGSLGRVESRARCLVDRERSHRSFVHLYADILSVAKKDRPSEDVAKEKIASVDQA